MPFPFIIKAGREIGKGKRVQGSGFRVQGSGFGVSPWGVLPLDYLRKRFSRFYGFKRVGATHNNQKRCGVLIALRVHRHFERSRESLLQNAQRLM